jgi:hypothetical protein
MTSVLLLLNFLEAWLSLDNSINFDVLFDFFGENGLGKLLLLMIAVDV